MFKRICSIYILVFTALIILCVGFCIGAAVGQEKVCNMRERDLKIHVSGSCSAFLDTFCDNGCWKNNGD